MKKDTNKKDVKTKLSLIYKFLIIIICGIGLYLNFKLFTFSKAIAYFTLQSNILCFIFYVTIFILYLTKKLKKNTAYHIIKILTVVSLTLTMVMYYFVIASHGITGYEGHDLECVIVHLIIPIMTILDYIIFDEKIHLKWYYAIVWSGFLPAYSILSDVYVAFGGTYVNGEKYAYFFMDPDVYSANEAIIFSTIIYVLFVLYSLIFIVINNTILKNKEKRK